MNFRRLECFRKTRTMESVSACIRHGAGVGLADPPTARRHGDAEIVFSRFEPAVTFKVALVLPRDRLRPGILEAFLRVLKSDLSALSWTTAGVRHIASPLSWKPATGYLGPGGTRAAKPVAPGRGGRQPGYTN